MTYKYVIGVDEAGRGPLAGPVTAGAVLLKSDFNLEGAGLDSGFRDSKKYTELQRSRWFDFIKNHSEIKFDFSSVWQEVIDRINVYEAANLASTRAVKRLVKRNGINPGDVKIILDGSLKLKSRQFEYESIVRGDTTEKPIQLASVVAKVKRDSAMKRVDRKHKKYKFAKHKGYGTKEHRELVEKHGPCEYHRLTFLSS